MKLRFYYSIYGTTEFWPAPSVLLASLRPRVDGLVCEVCPSVSAVLGSFVPGFDPLAFERMVKDADPYESQRSKFLFRFSETNIPAIMMDKEGPEEIDKSLEHVQVWLGTKPDGPHREQILEHIRRTRQVVQISPAPTPQLGSIRLARICEQLCGFMARESEGLILAIQTGFFSPEGESLLPYSPKHRLKTS